MNIDAHHHLWDYSAKEYGWISDDMKVLKRDFSPEDLKPILKKAAIEGTVAVQARTSLKENDFLLKHAKTNPVIKAVVGWVDLTQGNVAEVLAPYAEQDVFKGVRHVLQSEADDAYCLRKDFNQGLSELHDFGMIYDILIFHRHLPNSIKMVDQHPDQIFVLDHIAKPEIKSTTPDPAWAKNMQELAKREQVYCKISGMVTEVPPEIEWTPELLRPYFDVALEAFGPGRLMFGSDWPVALLRSDYQRWVETVRGFISDLSKDEQKDILGLTAARAYGIT
jgi:L-fuconolactonase